MNIYISGVGGQGTGMLSEILVRAIDYSGQNFRAVDTHGLAQRGGTVVSQIRFGENVYTPLISSGEAHMCIALELHEALRSLEKYIREGGILVYYNTIWEPLGVRLGKDVKTTEEDVLAYCKKHNITAVKAFDRGLKDTRMQNIVILAQIASRKLINGINDELIERAMADLMTGRLLESNLKVFRDNIVA
jgi:indolepyruvate ferredoxin oxidoreductase beta subunit